MRRAHDAIAEIHQFGTHGYRWVLDADIEACFDHIAHSALMDRVRARVKDKRVLALVKAFLKAGVLTETRRPRGHPHRHPARRHPVPAVWPTSPCRCSMSTCTGRGSPAGRCRPSSRRARRRAKGLPNWRIVRYADDFVVLVHGTEDDVADPARRSR